jgi:hypothetical protein
VRLWSYLMTRTLSGGNVVALTSFPAFPLSSAASILSVSTVLRCLSAQIIEPLEYASCTIQERDFRDWSHLNKYFSTSGEFIAHLLLLSRNTLLTCVWGFKEIIPKFSTMKADYIELIRNNLCSATVEAVGAAPYP